MASPVVVVVIVFLLAGSSRAARQRSLSSYSVCQWDRMQSLNCSFSRITTIPDLTVAALWTSGLNPTNRPTWPFSITIVRTVKHLNLSNNMITRLNLRVFHHFSTLESLNCNDNNIFKVLLNPDSQSYKKDGKKSLGFLKSLKFLSFERNQLNTVPKGLGKLKSLQTLCLSKNRISQIYQDDFTNCTELKSIDLRNNMIYKIHPNAFSDLTSLQVMQLSSNRLTTITPLVFLYSHVLQAKLDLSNNPWFCDNRMLALKHFTSFLSKDLIKEWKIPCTSPPSRIGQGFIPARDVHIDCEMPVEESFDIKTKVIPSGEKAVLHCDLPHSSGSPGTFWWTPQGIVFEDHQDTHYYMDKMRNLVLTLPGSLDEGLYVCVSSTMQRRVMYLLYIERGSSEVFRRSPRDIQAVSTQTRTQNDFALAVSLSVIISFICAFSLGVFTRPFIEKLWIKQCKSKKTKEQHSDFIYENEGFTDETLTGFNSTSTVVNRYPHTNILYEYQEESSLDSSVVVHEDNLSEQDSAVIENTVVICQINYPKFTSSRESNPGMVQHVENSITNQQGILHLPAMVRDEAGWFNNGNNIAIKENNESSYGNINKENYNLSGTKHLIEWEYDVSPQLIPKYDVADSSFTNSGDACNIAKSQKNKNLFPSHNFTSQHPTRARDGCEENASSFYHTEFNMPGVENDNPLENRNVGSRQEKHSLDNSDHHRYNKKHSTGPPSSVSNLSDDGSFFSFSLSNSLSGSPEPLEMPSDDDSLNVQPSSNDDEHELHSEHECLSGKSDSSISDNLSTLSSEGCVILSVSSEENERMCVTEQQGTKDMNILSRPQSQNDVNIQSANRNLQEQESDYSEEPDLQPVYNNPYLSDDHDLLQMDFFQHKMENRCGSTPVFLNEGLQTEIAPVICSSDKMEDMNTVKIFPDLLDAPYYPQSVMESTIHAEEAPKESTNDGSDLYKSEVLHQWLDSTRNENLTGEIHLPPVLACAADFVDNKPIINNERDILSNQDIHIGDTKFIVNRISYNDPQNEFRKFYGNLTYEIPDFGETNTDLPVIDLEFFTNGSLESQLDRVKTESDKIMSDNTGGYFVKRKRVFDGFAASFKNE